MSVTYNGLHVDERYSAILEPNLYFNPILVPGVTAPTSTRLAPPAKSSSTSSTPAPWRLAPPAGTSLTRWPLIR